MNYNQLLITAINSCISGGKEIMRIYNSNFKVEFKQDNSPLTLADKNCNKIIENFLLKTNIPILSEEGGEIEYNQRKEWELFWLVDPLDGTKEFIKRNGEFTVNIALISNGKPILGVVYVPVTKVVYFASIEIGAFKSCIDFEIPKLSDLILESTKLPSRKNKNKYVIVGSRSHMSNETKDFCEEKKNEHERVEMLSVGSSLKLCMVAEGIADVYPRFAPTMEWDTGAGHAIAKIAGFNVHNYLTKNELKYNKENLLNPWFIVF